MKNLIIMLIASVCMFALMGSTNEAKAQLVTMSVPAADDTLTNADTGYVNLTSSSPKDIITFEFKAVRSTGTAAGSAILQGSLDGTNYYDITTDTFTLSNVATQYKYWTVSPSSHVYYRIKVITSGTVSLLPTGKALIRKL